MDEIKIRSKIEDALISMGIYPNLKSFEYIVDATIEALNSDKKPSMCRGVYNKVAIKYDTTASRVERAIRYAVELAMQRGNFEKIHAMFGNALDLNRCKPTNSEFIYTLAHKVRREQLGA